MLHRMNVNCIACQCRIHQKYYVKYAELNASLTRVIIKYIDSNEILTALSSLFSMSNIVRI